MSEPKTSENQPGELRRDIRLIDAVGIGLGAIIGAGIFVVTGIAAGVAGPAFIVGLLIAGVAAACNALSSAELAAAYPQSGGTYEYGYRLLGPAYGFSAGWMFLASKLAAAGTVALGFGAYLSQIFPALPLRFVAVSAALLLTFANLFGIKKAGRINTFIVTLTIITLLYFVIAGAPSFNADNFKPFAPAGFFGMAESAALLFFAYTGYARIATLGEEVREPEKTIPRAIIITIAVSVVLYAAVALIAVGAVGAGRLAETASPLQAAAEAFSFPGVFRAVGLGAATAMFGVLLSQIIGISRMIFAMARRGDLPKVFVHTSAKYAVPDYGIILCGTIIVILCIFGTLQTVAAAAAFTILLYYGIANIAALKLEAGKKLYPKWIAVLGLTACLALAVSLPVKTILTGSALLLLGFMLRAVFQKFNGSTGGTV
jgi:APA family basic amino acid/polyamine antiporter